MGVRSLAEIESPLTFLPPLARRFCLVMLKNAIVNDSEWIPHYQRMVVAGKHARLCVFEKPYYTGGHRKSKGKLGRGSETTEDEKVLNRIKNAKRRETKVKDLIRCNVSVWKRTDEMIECNKFLTLTLKEPISDISEGNKFLKGFQARLTRLIRKSHPEFELKCIWVVEYQDKARGCLHWHILCNLPFIEQKWVITRNGDDPSDYAYLQKDGSFSPVADKSTRVFKSFHDAKKATRSLSSATGLDKNKLKCKKILYDLVVSWGRGFVDLETVSCPKKARAYTSKLCWYLTKSGEDNRFWGKRVFDYTRGSLEKPEIIDTPRGVDGFLDKNELWLCLERELFFECFLGFTELYVFDLWKLSDMSFNPPLKEPKQYEFDFFIDRNDVVW